MPERDFSQEPLSRLIPAIGHIHREVVHQHMRELGLYQGQGRVLLLLSERDGQTPTELRSERGVRASTITKTLQRMEKEGYVSRCRDPQDGRVVRVYITQDGRDLHARIKAFFDDFDEQTMRGLTDNERIILRRLLVQVVENMVAYLDD